MCLASPSSWAMVFAPINSSRTQSFRTGAEGRDRLVEVSLGERELDCQHGASFVCWPARADVGYRRQRPTGVDLELIRPHCAGRCGES